MEPILDSSMNIHGDETGFYFVDETCNFVGPYKTVEEAQEELEKYCSFLLPHAAATGE